MNIEEHITNNNDDSNDNIKFKISMKKLGLCDYSDAYTVVKETITVPDRLSQGATVNNTNEKVIFKNCALFTNQNE